ncbi:alkylation response protein AidB-like acyl-CoA dehydrogenase [Pseudomonas sp. SJZ079]|jgi:alkylation response protein AidB-like acyl-CoA dehydrogenase|uniref:acyl-CoA dehydrogenase family protein n=1 Tax=Pseudomonas sp. SJZ079 TaxID=2572887 RepID=UPI00119A701E|nr:acyl-CoA dehydrogenase family protein [Pseudomonas sp. SJZ079]TWC40213.1 alkylation response protein AidB-like acyl-CoA dehydrogenase [Pseudomonas sp. SJZ079]
MSITQFTYSRIPAEAESLRHEVREFLQNNLGDYPTTARAQSWMGFDAAFSRKLGARGWVGMALPKQYGGAAAGPFARYVIIEELLAAGAPVSAHWIADRQSGPLINRFGTEAQRERYLPPICRGESYFCIGMSEPNSGSDLASIKTTATRNDGGWLLNGQKVWTTNAQHAQFMIALVRTGEKQAARHEGMSQFIVDLGLPGITIRPIRDLAGGEHFNEVFFDNVQLDAAALIGTEGKGWDQVTAELAFERSGPERFLSCIELLKTLISAVGRHPDALQSREIGRLSAKLLTLRNMSLSVTAQLAAGEHPAWAASCVKDLGNLFEQEIPEVAQLLLEAEPRQAGGSEHAQVLAYLTQMAPSFSLRGGTREILRGIIARGMGLR